MWEIRLVPESFAFNTQTQYKRKNNSEQNINALICWLQSGTAFFFSAVLAYSFKTTNTATQQEKNRLKLGNFTNKTKNLTFSCLFSSVRSLLLVGCKQIELKCSLPLYLCQLQRWKTRITQKTTYEYIANVIQSIHSWQRLHHLNCTFFSFELLFKTLSARLLWDVYLMFSRNE